MSPVPTSRSETSYPTPRTQSTAHVLAALKSQTKHVVRNEISPSSTVASLPPRPLGTRQYTFTEEEDQVEDKALSFLDRTGHLSQVAGSQSMLSQELLTQGVEQYSQGEPSSQFSSISSKSPKSIARRYGILTQELDEEENVSIATAHNTKTVNSFQTPPRKGPTRKIVTAQTNKLLPSDHPGKPSLEDEALNSSQPSLTLSQLEAAANEPFGSQQSVASVPRTDGNIRRASSTSLISLCTAAEKHSSKSGSAQPVKRKYTRKLPCVEASTAIGPPPMKKAKSIASSNGSSDLSKVDPNEAMAGEIKWVGFSSKRREVNSDQQDTARRAAEVAQRIMMEGDDGLSKRLLLSMALNRDSPRQPPSQYPEQGAIPEGFVWAHYPPLESLLKENMEEYYNLSMAKCQSTKQQLFNNNLVDLVRDEASKHGWTFPTDRRTLRDRIRCYFKTHLQNAKKRLRTLLRNPTKRANAKNLVKLMEILPDAPEILGDASIENVVPQEPSKGAVAVQEIASKALTVKVSPQVPPQPVVAEAPIKSVAQEDATRDAATAEQTSQEDDNDYMSDVDPISSQEQDDDIINI